MNELVSPVLYLIVCAAPPAQHTTEVLSHLQAAGWDVCVIATPQASLWMDVQALAKHSGHVVRTHYKLPWETDPLPRADAMLVMPVTFNTINKWAAGISDTLTLGLLTEGIELGLPLCGVAVYKCGSGGAFGRSVKKLREAGQVSVVAQKKPDFS